MDYVWMYHSLTGLYLNGSFKLSRFQRTTLLYLRLLAIYVVVGYWGESNLQTVVLYAFISILAFRVFQGLSEKILTLVKGIAALAALVVIDLALLALALCLGYMFYQIYTNLEKKSIDQENYFTLWLFGTIIIYLCDLVIVDGLVILMQIIWIKRL